MLRGWVACQCPVGFLQQPSTLDPASIGAGENELRVPQFVEGGQPPDFALQLSDFFSRARARVGLARRQGGLGPQLGQHLGVAEIIVLVADGGDVGGGIDGTAVAAGERCSDAADEGEKLGAGGIVADELRQGRNRAARAAASMAGPHVPQQHPAFICLWTATRLPTLSQASFKLCHRLTVWGIEKLIQKIIPLNSPMN